MRSKAHGYNSERTLTAEQIESREYRDFVGGMWDEIGGLQFNFLVQEGLKPDMLLLDIGCGCFRGGVHFIKYLNVDRYFGIDLNKALLEIGYERELTIAGLQDKIPRKNLFVNNHFQFSYFEKKFDFALAVSLFTHVPLNDIRLCFIELAKCMKSGGRFYATFFEAPQDHPIESPLFHQQGGVTTLTDQDPYHYRATDFGWCIQGLPWRMDYIGDWNHPRSQKMLRFIRED